MVRALTVPQREGHLIGGECSKELGFIVAVSICAGPGQQGHLICELHALVPPCMPWCPSFLASTGQVGIAQRPGRDGLRPQVGTVSLVHSPAELLWSGAPCPWLPWCRGWQLDQDLLRVTRCIHHAQVWEAQEGLRCNAGHVKPVGPEPRGKHEGRCKGRGLSPS